MLDTHLDVAEQEAESNGRQGTAESEDAPTTPTADQVLIRALLEYRRTMQASLDTLVRLVEPSHTPVVESARVSSHGELKLSSLKPLMILRLIFILGGKSKHVRM